ncbi:MAG TPA: hypothetical protein VMW15_12835 [Terracidiphilus sp.]|nr:hypothetical protein [Terracidiphilus sp.]
MRTMRPVAPTGIAALDELLEGGLPIGAITEMAGPECSGRSSVALTFVSRLTGAGNICAWVDLSDALSPESAAAAGVELSRLLWVRCGVGAERAKPAGAYKFELSEKYLITPPAIHGLHGGGCGRHPRDEVRGLPEAVSGLLRPEAIATRREELQQRVRAEREVTAPPPSPRARQASMRMCSSRPWARIEQALRVTDLLLQAGGFSAIVLDMAGIAAEYVARVPMATWFRYRVAAERNQTSVLLLTQYACAKSSGELLLRFRAGQGRRDECTVFAGMEHSLEIERRRFAVETNVVPLRKPLQGVGVARWKSETTWAGAR